MASWSEVVAAAPELAALVAARFEAHGLGLLATLRRDGSPRVSGIEPLFAAGEVWLGMTDGSRKAADLQRDPRLAMHSATTDKQVADGDAKLSGRAVLVDDPATKAAYGAGFADQTGYPVPDEPFFLFRVDVAEISHLMPAGDHLVIQWWREGGTPQRVERR